MNRIYVFEQRMHIQFTIKYKYIQCIYEIKVQDSHSSYENSLKVRETFYNFYGICFQLISVIFEWLLFLKALLKFFFGFDHAGHMT